MDLILLSHAGVCYSRCALQLGWTVTAITSRTAALRGAFVVQPDIAFVVVLIYAITLFGCLFFGYVTRLVSHIVLHRENPATRMTVWSLKERRAEPMRPAMDVRLGDLVMFRFPERRSALVSGALAPLSGHTDGMVASTLGHWRGNNLGIMRVDVIYMVREAPHVAR